MLFRAGDHRLVRRCKRPSFQKFATFSSRHVVANRRLRTHRRYRPADPGRGLRSSSPVFCCSPSGWYKALSVLLLLLGWSSAASGATFGAVIGAVTTCSAPPRWLVGEWFRERFENPHGKASPHQRKARHNGLLVVMGVRPLPPRKTAPPPLRLSNYSSRLPLAASPITVMSGIGNLHGGFVATAIWVGHRRLRHRALRDHRLWLSRGSINLPALLIPLGAARTWKPDGLTADVA